MCGIAGIVRFDGRPVDEAFIRGVAEGLAHRGRDSQGVLFGSVHRNDAVISKTVEIALAHRRLSVIDLNQESAQPMSYAAGKLWIVFNGEIYNYIELREDLTQRGHQFRTRSDTEVILAAYGEWGEECVTKFNGMFAFALWDEKEQKLFCARDHVGIKPFYFHWNQSYFAFASEAMPLARVCGKGTDIEGTLSYLLCMYVAGNKSMFEDIEKLPPATAMTIRPDGSRKAWRYWTMERFGDRPFTPDAEREMAETIERAVALQLRSDVPVGALLSGGVDSTLVTAMAARQSSRLHTFTVGYEGLKVDERAHAREIAERYGTIHHEYFITEKEVMPHLERSIGASDAPIADTAMVASHILCGIAAGEGVKVLLGGTGGDEVFGGYLRYLERGFAARLLASSPPSVRRLASMFLCAPDNPITARVASRQVNQIVRAGGCAALCARAAAPHGGFGRFIDVLLREHMPAFPAKSRGIYANMAFDMAVYLPDELLVLLDQMTMAWTIEGRVPLLDRNVIEAAFRFPQRVHVEGDRTKMLLRRLAIPYIGEKIAAQAKQGFGGPVEKWVNGHKGVMLEKLPAVKAIKGLEGLDISRYTDRNGKIFTEAEAQEVYRLYCLAVWSARLT